MKITSTTVRVMRSHDYCQFEVSLTGEVDFDEADLLGTIDELRKDAARLVDQAVVQYEVAKRNAQLMLQDERRREHFLSTCKAFEQVTEGDRTPAQKAALKALADETYLLRPRFNYEDDWDEPEPYEHGLNEY